MLGCTGKQDLKRSRPAVRQKDDYVRVCVWGVGVRTGLAFHNQGQEVEAGRSCWCSGLRKACSEVGGGWNWVTTTLRISVKGNLGSWEMKIPIRQLLHIRS